MWFCDILVIEAEWKDQSEKCLQIFSTGRQEEPLCEMVKLEGNSIWKKKEEKGCILVPLNLVWQLSIQVKNTKGA